MLNGEREAPFLGSSRWTPNNGRFPKEVPVKFESFKPQTLVSTQFD
jgi:hypothetical protein